MYFSSRPWGGGRGGGRGRMGFGAQLLSVYIYTYLNLELLFSCPPLRIFNALNLELLLFYFPSTPTLKGYFRIYKSDLKQQYTN